MSAITTTSKCAFCGEPAEYQCDWKHVLKEERLSCPYPEHKHNGRVNTWFTKCHTVMCYRCVMELADNYHVCLWHTPVVAGEDEMEYARRERG